MIYFIQAENGGPIKIGYAAHSVGQRIKELQVGNPYTLVCLASIEGRVYHEQRLHQKFGKYRIRGEWFEPSEELLDFIKNVDNFDINSIRIFSKKKKVEIDRNVLVEELYAASSENDWDFPTVFSKFKDELYKRGYSVHETFHLSRWFESHHRKRFEEKRAVIGLQLGNF